MTKSRVGLVVGLLVVLGLLILGGGWFVPRYLAARHFCQRGDTAAETYGNGLLRVLEIRKNFGDEDAERLRGSGWANFYPLTHLSFDDVAFQNTLPIREIPELEYFFINGSPDKNAIMDETSLANILRGKRLQLVSFTKTWIPRKLLESAPRYRFASVWLNEVPLSDDDLERFLCLEETESLYLISVPVTQKTIDKIAAEGARLKTLYLWGIPLENLDLDRLKALKSLEELNVKENAEPIPGP